MLIALLSSTGQIFCEDETFNFLMDSKASKLDVGILKLNMELIQYKQNQIEEALLEIEPEVRLRSEFRFGPPAKYVYWPSHPNDGYHIDFLIKVNSDSISFEQCQKISNVIREKINYHWKWYFRSIEKNEPDEFRKKRMSKKASSYFIEAGFKYKENIAEDIARKYRFRVELIKTECAEWEALEKCVKEEREEISVSCNSDLFSKGIEFKK